MKQLIKWKAIKIFLFAFLLFAAGITKAQIGIGIANPAASAQLDVTSTNKGLLPPRMTQAQRDAIASPAAGLMIWCSNCGASGEIQVYNGTTWTNMIGGVASAPVTICTVTIGTQVWMKKNLDVSTYRNGDTIPQVTDPQEWAELTTGAWCYYNNDPAMGVVYGKLYNWYAVNDPRGLAPQGWHVPTCEEWISLIDFLGGYESAGGKMKESGLTHWISPNADASNSSGFTALPGGFRGGAVNNFYYLRSAGFWWASTIISPISACGSGLYSDYGSIGLGNPNSWTGQSVRCVRD
jgi:uncharacterized protein (TIGR02145 family)